MRSIEHLCNWQNFLFLVLVELKVETSMDLAQTHQMASLDIDGLSYISFFSTWLKNL